MTTVAPIRITAPIVPAPKSAAADARALSTASADFHGFAEERLLQRAQRVSHTDENSQPREQGEFRKRLPRADQHLQFRREAAETRQPHRGEPGDGKRPRRKRQRPAQVHAFQQRQFARVRPVINHPAHHAEQQACDDAVRKHLQHRAAQADGVDRHQPQQNEAHVAHARIADDEFEVLLHQRHRRAIDDADDREQRDLVAPRHKAEREEAHRHAQRSVRAQFHHHAGQEHRGRRRRRHMARRRPRMERPHARQNRKPNEHQRKRPKLKRFRERILRQFEQVHRVHAARRPRTPPRCRPAPSRCRRTNKARASSRRIPCWSNPRSR